MPWWRLRDRRLAGFKFRRQHAMGPFIVDFACLDRRLIVELDGGQHTEHAKFDNARTEWLCGRGCGVRRYWNDDAMLNVGSVLDDILMHLSVPIAVPPHPNPLPARGERER
ncbi:MAG: endonuclease domain-containing protein [Betaproteobacteria bacterium]|nr:endonuclease domain-containing protein [Betaproteobacteria bacterium]